MRALRNLRQLVQWNLSDRTQPPPQFIKQRIVKEYQRRYALSVFIETGTYLGDMIDAVRDVFRELYSVELSQELFERARERFADCPSVHILQGDSSEVLPRVLENLKEPALFWLDGHFSGGITARGSVDFPILQELAHISRHPIKDHLILIDDARLFDGQLAMPDMTQLAEGLKAINPQYVIQQEADIIRACPP